MILNKGLRSTCWCHASWLIPIFMGSIAFLSICGPDILNPGNIAWLSKEDFSTHYLGWVYFRDSAWSLPLGLNPDYGLELSNTIVYSDSIPLLAILSKFLSPILPDPFQYFGLWLGLCFILQACFAWQLMGLLSQNLWVRTLGSCLFVLAPPMIYRLGIHIVLVGHFPILAALYLCLRPNNHRRFLYWFLLIVTTAFIHAYLLAMVILIWVADTIDRKPDIDRKSFYGLLISIVSALWLAGYFGVGGSVNGAGFGFSRMNLLSPIDPSGWSYLLPDLPEKIGDHEGFNYFGLGIMVLMLVALYSWIFSKHHWSLKGLKKPALITALVLLTLFSLSSNIGIGDYDLPEIPLNDYILYAASIFRSSGRMFWPVFYCLLYWFIKSIAHRYDLKTVTGILIAAVFLQFIDTHAGWKNIRAGLTGVPSSQWVTGLNDPFWEEAASHYLYLRALPLSVDKARFMYPDTWQMLPYFAATHHMPTDMAYLARYRYQSIIAAQTSSLKTLEDGSFAQDTLYIVDASYLSAVQNNIRPDRDFLGMIDGYYVLAPGWRTRQR